MSSQPPPPHWPTPPHGYPQHPNPWEYRLYRHQSHWGGRGPRRIIWFALGATAAVLYSKHRGEGNSCWERPSWGHRAPPPSSPELGPPTRSWDDEFAKVSALKRQAGSAAVDISEAGLNSILSTVSALKLKLSEERARRDTTQGTQPQATGPLRQIDESGRLV